MQQPAIQSFFGPATFTVTYVVADQVVAYVQQAGLTVDWLLETHAHADHLSAAPYLQQQLGGQIAIGQHICEVQGVFKKVFNAKDMDTEGAEFDHLFEDGELFHIGAIEVRVMHTPGHTPACLTYVMGLDVFVGDTLFMPDYGTARCDFPGGDAATLYQSIQKVLALPPNTRLHLCHDYPPPSRDPIWETTVAQERAANIHVHDGVTEAEFVARRTARDKTLSMPVLILPAVQVNVRAGRLPSAEDNGVRYLKIPIDAL